MDSNNKNIKSKEISLSDLRKAINMIFDHMDCDLNLNKVELDHDYYASINLHEKFEILLNSKDDSFSQSINIGLGHLYDDWDFLENMIKHDTAVTLMFEHVAPLLRYIGYKAVKESEINRDTK